MTAPNHNKVDYFTVEPWYHSQKEKYSNCTDYEDISERFEKFLFPVACVTDEVKKLLGITKISLGTTVSCNVLICDRLREIIAETSARK